MTEYLLTIAIGPVQDFIAAARKARDLWAGSNLLSEIAKSMALHLSKAEHTLIFPSAENPSIEIAKKEFNAANILLAIVKTENPKHLVAQLKQIAQARLLEEWDRAFGKACHDGRIDKDLAGRQLAVALEFFAAWQVLSPNYQQSFAELRATLAARKNIRNFPHYQGEPGLFKSSLDGRLEGVIKRYPDVPESRLGESEQLDALGLIKRYGSKPEKTIESTSDVAILPFIAKVERKCPQLLNKYKAEFEEGYSILYESESRQSTNPDKAKLHEGIRKEFLKHNLIPSPPYYCMLAGDGDRMGETLNSLTTFQAHQSFSKYLGGFSIEARKIVLKHGGFPIYTGGDDVLALLPLHTALACAEEINRAFAEAMESFPDASFSAGLVVAHAMDPLSETRQHATDAEKMAKSVDGKNALAITVVPRSGASITAADHWEPLLSLLNEIRTLVQQEELASSFGYDLRALDKRIPPNMDHLLPDLAKHLASKKKGSAQAGAFAEKYITDRLSLKNAINALLISRPFNKAISEATGI